MGWETKKCPTCGKKNRIDIERASAENPVCGRCRQRLYPPAPDLRDDEEAETTEDDHSFSISTAAPSAKRYTPTHLDSAIHRMESQRTWAMVIPACAVLAL